MHISEHKSISCDSYCYQNKENYVNYLNMANVNRACPDNRESAGLASGPALITVARHNETRCGSLLEHNRVLKAGQRGG